MFGLSLAELAVVAVVALIFLGPDKLPAVLRQLAKGYRQLAKIRAEVSRAVEKELKPELERLTPEADGLKKIQAASAPKGLLKDPDPLGSFIGIAAGGAAATASKPPTAKKQGDQAPSDQAGLAKVTPASAPQDHATHDPAPPERARQAQAPPDQLSADPASIADCPTASRGVPQVATPQEAAPLADYPTASRGAPLS